MPSLFPASWPSDAHPGWLPILSPLIPAMENALQTARARSSDGLCPEEGRILRFTKTDPARIRIVVLGQDPYPQPGAATGRSFEVAGLSDWQKPFRQVSLKNILRAIHAAVLDTPVQPFREVQSQIADGRFPILPPNRLFDSLETQGVLFLNAYLTCAAGHPLSHRAVWRPVAERLLSALDAARPGLSFFLWGTDARSFAPLLPNAVRYESRHPMLCGNYPDDFLKNPCFQETAKLISWTGL